MAFGMFKQIFFLILIVSATSTAFNQNQQISKRRNIPSFFNFFRKKKSPPLASSLVVTELTRFQRYSALSMCAFANIKNWECKRCEESLVRGTLNVTRIRDEKQKIGGYIAFHPSLKHKNDQVIILAFRGVEVLQISNWIIAVRKCTQVPLLIGSRHSLDLLVNDGMQFAYRTLQAQVRSLVAKLLNQYPAARIVCTGYSFGAGLATMAALDLASYLDQKRAQMEVYTYGGTRHGNRKFASLLHEVFQDRYYRVTSNKDPFPHIPIRNYKGFDWVQAPREYFITKTKQVYVCNEVDGEDENGFCSNSIQKFEKQSMSKIAYNAFAPSTFYVNDHYYGYFDNSFIDIC